MTRTLVCLMLVAACGAKQPPPTPTGSGSGPAAASCDDARANVSALYEALAKATDQATHDPTFVEDNVEMVMKDCATDPAKVAACARGAATVAALEQQCLVPLDEEGTEGERIGR